jgi:hypothetical protein
MLAPTLLFSCSVDDRLMFPALGLQFNTAEEGVRAASCELRADTGDGARNPGTTRLLGMLAGLLTALQRRSCPVAFESTASVFAQVFRSCHCWLAAFASPI